MWRKIVISHCFGNPVALEQSRRAVDAERQEYTIENQNAIAQKAEVMQYVALHKALGGGWQPHDEPPPLEEAQPAFQATARRLTNGDVTGKLSCGRRMFGAPFTATSMIGALAGIVVRNSIL
jgi:hypothetical protein